MKTVILAHGILGFDKLGISDFTLAEYFNGVKSALESEGYSVFSPEVDRVASIERRAASLYEKVMQYIDKKQCAENSIVILAHSMGGLDARLALLLENSTLAHYTQALVTIGTPHLGSPVADLLVHDLSITQFIYNKTLQLFGESVAGLSNLTRAKCTAFDMNTPTVDGVNYYSIAGKTDESSSLFFKTLGRLVPEESDGVVSVASARKTDAPWQLLPDWPVDHAGLVGWFDLGFGRNVAFDEHIQRYIDLVKYVEK